MAVNRLSELSTTISENTKIVSDYLTSKGLSAPSFDVDGLDEFAISSSDKQAFTARLNVIAATKELHDLSSGTKRKSEISGMRCTSTMSLSLITLLTYDTRALTVSPFMACPTTGLPKQYPSTEKSLTLIFPRKST
jgi:hypothetical protein